MPLQSLLVDQKTKTWDFGFPNPKEADFPKSDSPGSLPDMSIPEIKVIKVLIPELWSFGWRSSNKGSFMTSL